MPIKKKITSEQRQAVAKLLIRRASVESVRRKTGLSKSSIGRIAAYARAVFLRRKQSQADIRIRRILAELGFRSPVIEDSLIERLEEMAPTTPKAEKVVTLIKAKYEAMRDGNDMNYNIALKRAARVPAQTRRDIMEGYGKGMFTAQGMKKLLNEDSSPTYKPPQIKGTENREQKNTSRKISKTKWLAWKREHDEALALYLNLKGKPLSADKPQARGARIKK